MENNCRVSPIHYSCSDVEIVFQGNEETELLIDIAHADSYEHLSRLSHIRYPGMIHLADKHFAIDHEHLPIGQGELDFHMIFSDILAEFSGKIILEIDQSDDAIIESVKKIEAILADRVI